jgi:hypothetical protein
MPGAQGRGERNWLRRSENEKTQAKERGEDISDEEAKLRAVAKLHRPKLRPLDNSGRYADPYDPRRYGTEIVLDDVSVALPKCWTMEPESVRAGRNYKKLTKQVARMIEQGKAQAGEICFMCSEFFVFRRNGEDFIVQCGDPRYFYRIDKTSLRVCYEVGTATLGRDATIKIKSPGVFHYYLTLYDALC